MVARQSYYIATLYHVADPEGRLTHTYSHTFGLVAAGHDTTVVVAQHNDSTSLQSRVNAPFTAYKEIIAIRKSDHKKTGLMPGRNRRAFPYRKFTKLF